MKMKTEMKTEKRTAHCSTKIKTKTSGKRKPIKVEKEYEIENVNMRGWCLCGCRTPFHKVKWVGYRPQANSWEKLSWTHESVEDWSAATPLSVEELEMKRLGPKMCLTVKRVLNLVDDDDKMSDSMLRRCNVLCEKEGLAKC
jgi:hypothetical protein